MNNHGQTTPAPVPISQASGLIEQQDQLKDRFLRYSSHQLRAPLAAVHTMLSALDACGPMNEKQRELVGRIKVRLEEAAQMLDEIAQLVSIREQTADTLWLKDVDIDAVLTAAVRAIGPAAQAKGVKLDVSAESHMSVRAWDTGIELVCRHLLENAVKYTPSGGQVTAKTHPTPGRVELLVSDTGIGIPFEQQVQLFHEFFRATNARQAAGGTGMGLALVKAVMDRLGGQVDVQSALDRGTTVKVVLPAAGDVALPLAKAACL